jgi:uncharacterized protein
MMNVPSKIETFRLIHRMEMMAHIATHSFQVCSVSLLLADRLKGCGIDLNRSLIQASAMLHDITKTRSIKTNENHAQTGFKLLRDLGYPEVGNVVRQHIVLDDYHESKPLGEADIVNYSDKRVLHDRVVSLDERKNYILERYGTEAEFRKRIIRFWEKTERLEKRIFAHLSFSPHELGIVMKPEGWEADYSLFQQSLTPS